MSFKKLIMVKFCQLSKLVGFFLSPEEQASLRKMNNLYCGMSYVLNLMETVSSCLELCDRLHFENSPAGAALLAGNPAFHSKVFICL